MLSCGKKWNVDCHKIGNSEQLIKVTMDDVAEIEGLMSAKDYDAFTAGL